MHLTAEVVICVAPLVLAIVGLFLAAYWPMDDTEPWDAALW